MPETNNLLPKLGETPEEARDRAFNRLPTDDDAPEYEAAQASLHIAETRRYPFRKTLAVIGLVAITPILVRSLAESQHYGYHGQSNPNIPTQIQP